MAARNRSVTYTRISGGRYFNNNPGVIIGAGPIPTDFGTCADITGPGDCAPLTVHRRSTDGGIIERHNAGAFASTFDSYICDWLRNTSNGPHLGVSGVPSNLEVATSAAARTNPSAAIVDVPVNILEIRPGIHALRERGNDILRTIRRTGGRYLEYQFLIRPVVSDIVKLLNCQESVDRRIHAINKLYDGRGIRRTTQHGVYSSQSASSATVQSAGVTINRTFDVNTKVVRSCHIRWKPSSRCGVQPSPDVVRRWAVRSVQGLTIDFSTLWEILPWSWLADWFGNVGTFLKASRNIVPAQVVGVFPMTHTYTLWSCKSTPIANGTFSGINSWRDTKTRDVSFVAPIAYLPFLNGGQMGILAALAATRVR